MTNFLKDLIKDGEGGLVEFKKTISNPAKIAKTLCSFANSKGGYVLIGIADNKAIIGVEPEEEKFLIEQANELHCSPSVTLAYSEEISTDGKTILLVYVSESERKPHHLKTAKGEDRVYVRSGDQCLLAAPSVIRALKNENPDEPKSSAMSNNKNVQKLFSYLSTKRRITVKQYAKLINVSKRRADKILKECSLHGYLYEHDFEKQSFYTLAKG